MKKHSESDAAAYAEAIIAAILALGTLDGHRLEMVIDKYREVLMKLRENPAAHSIPDSNLVGRCTGKSAGIAPFKIRPV
jgi:hypothetical protein